MNGLHSRDRRAFASLASRIGSSLGLLLRFWVLGALLTGCLRPVAPAKQPAPVEYWPTAGWRTSAPEAQGMDGEKLAQMLAEVQGRKLELHSLLVIRNGHIVSETYFGSYRQDTQHELYSCTKSFVATLVGIAIDQGRVGDVGQKVLGLLPGRTFANPDPRKEAMTLEHLLTMTSGLDWPEGDPAYRAMYLSRDWVQYVLDEPMREAPGSRFNYCSGCSHLLSAIVQQHTGMNVRDYAQQNLLGPLGISSFNWERDAQGIPIGGWGLQLTPRDMAKLGYLYLHNGNWEGKQVVSAGWVRAATQKHTATDSNLGYGYQWWIYPKFEAYTALGRYGQTIFVAPRLELIIVTTAALGSHEEVYRLIEQYIVPAARERGT